MFLSEAKVEGTVNGIAIIQKSADKPTRRFSVTMVSYRRECLMAMYLSTLIMARWDSDAFPNTLKVIVDENALIQYENALVLLRYKCAIIQETKAG